MKIRKKVRKSMKCQKKSIINSMKRKEMNNKMRLKKTLTISHSHNQTLSMMMTPKRTLLRLRIQLKERLFMIKQQNKRDLCHHLNNSCLSNKNSLRKTLLKEWMKRDQQHWQQLLQHNLTHIQSWNNQWHFIFNQLKGIKLLKSPHLLKTFPTLTPNSVKWQRTWKLIERSTKLKMQLLSRESKISISWRWSRDILMVSRPATDKRSISRVPDQTRLWLSDITRFDNQHNYNRPYYIRVFSIKIIYFHFTHFLIK